MKDFTLYLDMDGVLCDFVQHFVECFGHWYPQIKNTNNFEILMTLPKDECARHMNNYPEWYYTIPWMPQGELLFEYCRDNFSNIKILTTPFDSVKACKKDKSRWVLDNLGNYEIIFSHHKHEYANKNSILIDDRKYNIDPFVERGGHGILYTDFDDCIHQLISLKWGLLYEKNRTN